MPEATKPHRSGPPVNKALGSEEASGGMAASETNTNTNSATAEPSRMTNPLKARKRTKTGCLSKSSWNTVILESVTHTPQHAASGASSAVKSARPVKIVSSRSASAKAIFLESFSRTLLVLSGQCSKELLLAPNILPILMELQASTGAFLQHPWIPQLRRVSFRMGSKLGLDACLRQVDP